MLKFVYEPMEWTNIELLEKMKDIRTYEEYSNLLYEYSEDECIHAFAEVNEYFNIDFINEVIADCDNYAECSNIINAIIQDAFYSKYPDNEE